MWLKTQFSVPAGRDMVAAVAFADDEDEDVKVRIVVLRGKPVWLLLLMLVEGRMRCLPSMVRRWFITRYASLCSRMLVGIIPSAYFDVIGEGSPANEP